MNLVCRSRRSRNGRAVWQTQRNDDPAERRAERQTTEHAISSVGILLAYLRTPVVQLSRFRVLLSVDTHPTSWPKTYDPKSGASKHDSTLPELDPTPSNRGARSRATRRTQVENPVENPVEPPPTSEATAKPQKSGASTKDSTLPELDPTTSKRGARSRAARKTQVIEPVENPVEPPPTSVATAKPQISTGKEGAVRESSSKSKTKSTKAKSVKSKQVTVKRATPKQVKPKKNRKGSSKKKAAQSTTSEHALDDEIYLEANATVEMNLDEDTQLPASGVSVEASHVSAGQWIVTPSPPSEPLICEVCQKPLKTKHGLRRHVMSHKIADANSRRPSSVVLQPLVEDMVVTTLEEMQLEFGKEKREYIEAILNSRESENWKTFLSEISDPFLEKFSMPTKIFPSNQYGDELKELNRLLNNREAYAQLLSSFDWLNITVSVPQHVPGMVLFRLCSKLVDKLAQFVFREMKEKKPTCNEASVEKMSDIEREAFVIHVRKLLQEYYKRGLKGGSKVWLSRCACIRQKFIESGDSSEVPTVDMVLDNQSWEQDKSGNVKLKLSDSCVDFFTKVEEIIESLFKGNESVNCDKVVDVVLKSIELLDAWFSLTMLFFSEVESLVFMKDVISIVVNLSMKLEVNRLREENRGRVNKYALRTDLKRN
ncbi:uncharacterized protein LOC117647866 [Thrips palmi]|uniref:Uncharacterized protein LOC117647866 n=1 Tax=Thrips palmi TaxID=161013 RepID=A0A6P8YZX1_THRPL|nr:uncharacterized protein LOC117647866 [Thrips palmi]